MTGQVGALSASGTSAESRSLTAIEPGTYYYGVCVDAVTDQSDTTNKLLDVGAGDGAREQNALTVEVSPRTLDRSLLEVYANGRQCVTQRIYPTRQDAVEVLLLVAHRGVAMVRRLDAWELAPAHT